MKFIHHNRTVFYILLIPLILLVGLQIYEVLFKLPSGCTSIVVAYSQLQNKRFNITDQSPQDTIKRAHDMSDDMMEICKRSPSKPEQFTTNFQKALDLLIADRVHAPPEQTQ